MMQIINCTKPPRPLPIHGLVKQSIRRVKVERNPKDGKIGVRQANVQVPETITIMPGMSVNLPDEWEGCPDIVRYKKLKQISIKHIPDPVEEIIETNVGDSKSKKKVRKDR